MVISMSTPIQFYFDFSSPYSYVASTWLDGLAAQHGRTVERHAILLGVIFQAAESKSPVSYPMKREYSIRDFARSARFHGVTCVIPDPFPIPTQNAARIFWWLKDTQGEAAAAAWAQAGLRAVFQRGLPLNDAATLKAVAADAGLDPAQAEAAWNDPVWKDRLKRANEQAITAGVFGAPYVIVDGEPFWGNDRHAQIERWLASGPY